MRRPPSGIVVRQKEPAHGEAFRVVNPLHQVRLSESAKGVREPVWEFGSGEVNLAGLSLHYFEE